MKVRIENNTNWYDLETVLNLGIELTEEMKETKVVGYEYAPHKRMKNINLAEALELQKEIEELKNHECECNGDFLTDREAVALVNEGYTKDNIYIEFIGYTHDYYTWKLEDLFIGINKWQKEELMKYFDEDKFQEEFFNTYTEIYVDNNYSILLS